MGKESALPHICWRIRRLQSHQMLGCQRMPVIIRYLSFLRNLITVVIRHDIRQDNNKEGRPLRYLARVRGGKEHLENDANAQS